MKPRKSLWCGLGFVIVFSVINVMLNAQAIIDHRTEVVCDDESSYTD